MLYHIIHIEEHILLRYIVVEHQQKVFFKLYQAAKAYYLQRTNYLNSIRKSMKKIISTVTITLIATSLLSGCNLTTTTHSNAPVTTTTTAKTAATTNNSEQQRVNRLIADIWQYQLKRRPQSADRKGTDAYRHLLNDLSPQALQMDNKKLNDYLVALKSINRSQLNNQDIINVDILIRQIQNDIDKYHNLEHYTPYKSESGFHSDLAFLPSAMPFNHTKDFENYLSRLKGFETFFAQNIHWMKQGLAQGITHPKAVLVGFEDSIAAFIVDDPKKSIFYSPLNKPKPKNLTEQQYQQFKTRIATVIKNEVIPQYQHFYEFMVKQYIPNARQTIGISHFSHGNDYYQNRVKYFTTTDMSAKQVHQIGLSEVARIKAQMEQIIEKLQFNGSFAQFIEYLRTSPQFYATSAEQLLKEASYISKQMDAKLPSLFNHLPRNPYGVTKVPDHIAPKYTTGRYIGPTRDDQAGFYWVNTYALDKRPLYVLEALTLHEAVPGHHLQNALNRELDNLPPHRQFSYISAFGEGWGLYAEFLGIEAGFYQNPYSDFGRLSYEMWRACRLVVDTGMHVFGWSRQQAIDYLQNNTALSKHNVVTEIDRYISWPGQALSYKIGELTIKRLRKKTEQALGEKFDLREFHRQILRHGSVPLDVLEQQIEAYINEVNLSLN